jgi:uncharacterized surface protein with fasciclin (FAS1) repeats
MRALATIAAIAALSLPGCRQEAPAPEDAAAPAASGAPVRHASNVPPLDATNIVSIARGSPDHTTLVAAIEAADYVTSVAASGPFTVFAPTNAAFAKLPPGTVEGLLEPERADQLREILKYHVTTSALATSSFRDGQSLGMANGAKTTIHVKDGEVTVNDAKVITSIPASNGIVHVVDAVLLPPAAP